MKRTVLVFLLGFWASIAFGAGMELSGAGATFPEPLYTAHYAQIYRLMNIQVNYQGIGSGGGIRQLINQTVDFGGTDAPMKESELQSAGAKVLHIPTCIGAVVVTYNIPGVDAEVKFTPEVLSAIFLGKIRYWNDPAIAALNPGLNFPKLAVTVVHRSDGSGTTYIFTDYLSSVSPEWKAKYGANKAINWQLGLGGKGNPGVAQYIKMIPGSIGYVEVAYAHQAKMPIALLQNKSGNYIRPTMDALTRAADMKMPADTRVSLVNTSNPKGYPICSFSWIILYQEQKYQGRDLARAKNLLRVVWWQLHEGQAINETKEYGALPPSVVNLSENLLRSVVYEGQTIRR